MLIAVFAAIIGIWSPMEKKSIVRQEYYKEIVVSVASEARSPSRSSFFRSTFGATVEPLMTIQNPQTQLERKKQPQYLHLYILSYSTYELAAEAFESLKSSPEFNWVYPNYEYLGDPREFTPNDEMFGRQGHHESMESEAAWDVAVGGPGIRVAITDDGFQLEHSDLKSQWYVNSNEIPNNGKDDDQNGYVDDVQGWNFGEDNNRVYDKGDGVHGTHVAGIVGAQMNNEIGVCGIGAGVTLLPIKFYGKNPWTSVLVSKAYKYAVDQGAHIISTSYNIDHFENDPIFESALEYVQQKGVLHFNSAGNNDEKNPPRQKFDQLLLVCSTWPLTDEISQFTNYGWGIDFCAPGSNILSTIPENRYSFNSGTSMAAPQAAGLAALIWSLHPDWNSEQVAAQLLGTADTLKPSDPKYKGLLGSGRINARRALTEGILPPRIKSVIGMKLFDAKMAAPSSLTLDLQGVFAASSWSQEDALELLGAGEDDTFGTSDDFLVELQQKKPYRIGTNRLSFSFDPLPPGTYRLRARHPFLVDPFGQMLDGNQDGIGGDDFFFIFEVNPR